MLIPCQFQFDENINLEKTAVVVTSKSGETIETISQLCFILDEFKKKKISTKKNS